MSVSLNLTDIDMDKIKIGKVGRVFKLMYEKNPLELVTSKLYLPFNVKVNTQYKTYNMDCSLNQSNSEISKLHRSIIESLDEKIKTLIKENIELFSNDINVEDVDNIYLPLLRENKNYPKLLKISLQKDTRGNFTFVVFDEKKEKVVVNESNISDILCKGKVFKSIIRCNKIRG